MVESIMYAGKDIAGKRYGRLVVVASKGVNEHRKLIVECLCNCGNYKEFKIGNLKKKNGTRSCGCYKRKLSSTRNKILHLKHGHSTCRDGVKNRASPEYSTWLNIRKRCHVPTAHAYQYYGGKGIEVCERWRGSEDFPKFLADMGERPSKFYYLARIDVEKNFSPKNCEWRHRSLFKKSVPRKTNLNAQG